MVTYLTLVDKSTPPKYVVLPKVEMEVKVKVEVEIEVKSKEMEMKVKAGVEI